METYKTADEYDIYLIYKDQVVAEIQEINIEDEQSFTGKITGDLKVTIFDKIMLEELSKEDNITTPSIRIAQRWRAMRLDGIILNEDKSTFTARHRTPWL